MRLILNQNVINLGDKNDIVEVSDGYARNYLIPKKLAILADANSLKKMEEKKKRAAVLIDKEKEQYRQIADKLDNLKVEVKADVGEEGKLFGSVTSQDIALAVKELISIDLDKKQIILNEPIKIAGNIDVKVKFTSDISATLLVLVSPKQ